MADSVQVGQIQAVFKSVRLPFGLLVDEMHVEGADLLVTTEPVGVKLPSAGNVIARVGEASLNEFLRLKVPKEVRDPVASIADGQIIVEATVRMIVELRAVARCSLQIKGGKQLHVVLDTVEVAGLGAKSLVQGQLDQINPVLDAAEMPLPMTLEQANILEGMIEIRGTIGPV
ncbi:MAG TPA: LmeA family phospholipid-binding protein [Fimbriimonadaceae bacterium]|nr:LmeA family phospholipid-binding protein [Fimbriimonadaceae bacterium]